VEKITRRFIAFSAKSLPKNIKIGSCLSKLQQVTYVNFLGHRVVVLYKKQTNGQEYIIQQPTRKPI